jgi:hypothetical protein
MNTRLFAAVLGLALPVLARDDTPALREREAERYMKARPPAEMLQNAADQLARDRNESAREAVKAELVKAMDSDAFTQAAKQALVRLFTADELTALADFYESPLGQSATKKNGAYLAALKPALQAQLIKAQARSRALAAAAADSPEAKRACINNLRILDAAKEQAAMESRWNSGHAIEAGGSDEEKVLDYIKGRAMPVCPAGGQYRLNPIGQNPVCTVDGHELP